MPLLTIFAKVQVVLTFVDWQGNPLPAGVGVALVDDSSGLSQGGNIGEGGTLHVSVDADSTYTASFTGIGAPTGTVQFTATGNAQTIQLPQPPVTPPKPVAQSALFVAPQKPITVDQAGFATRILSTIPKRWFSDAARTDTGDRSTTGLLYAVAFGMASGFGYVCDLEIPYTRNQTRWKTRSDTNLDLAAYDIFGDEMVRQNNESDPQYSLRIRKRIPARLQTLDAILTAVVNYYLAAEAITANKVLQDFGLGTIGGLGTRGGLAIYQPSSVQTLVPTVYVFDTQSDPTSAAAFGITFGQVAIVLEWLTDASAFFLDYAHLSRETLLGHQAQIFDSTKFTSNAPAPDANLDVVVRRVKAGGIRPVYIVRSTT